MRDKPPDDDIWDALLDAQSRRPCLDREVQGSLGRHLRELYGSAPAEPALARIFELLERLARETQDPTAEA